MTGLELLTWARGPGLAWALAICCFGVVLRLGEILALGHKADLAPPRPGSAGSGWRTLFSRSLPPPGMLRRAPLTYLGGYVFHLGMAVAVFFFVPHIQLFHDLLGWQWPGLPNLFIDIATVAALLAMLALAASRLANPVKRLLSGFGDWLAWGLSFLPLATGFAAFHHLIENYSLMLALHLLAAELLLVALPFTKLFHVFSLFLARWYNGEIAGRKGVAS